MSWFGTMTSKKQPEGVLTKLKRERAKQVNKEQWDEFHKARATEKKKAQQEKLRERAAKRAALKKSKQYKAYKGITGAITPKLPKKKKQTKKISRKMRIKAF